MKTLEKKLIQVSTQYIDSSYLEGAVSDVVDNLLKFDEQLKAEVSVKLPPNTEVIILLETECYGYDGGKEFYLKAYRYETDEEFKLRLSAKQAKENVVRQRELATLAKLKAKYGDVS